jgi:hypothetical protein
MWENATPGRDMERMSVGILAREAPAPARRRGALHALGLMAGAVFLFGLWARGLPEFVAWEVASDHQRCFGRRQLPARVWSAEPAEVQDWLESRGTPAPPLPPEAGSAPLVGARYCPLADRVAAHVYYGGDGSGIVSVFLLSGPARIGDGWAGTARGLHVRLVRAAGRTLAVVGESADDVATTARSFATTVAKATPRTAAPVDRSWSSC